MRLPHERLLIPEVTEKCVIVSRVQPDKVLDNYLVVDWPEQIEEIYVEVSNRVFRIRGEQKERFEKIEQLNVKISEWLNQFPLCQRVRITLRQNRELELCALSEDEYEKELQLEEAARGSMRRTPIVKEEKKDKPGKKPRYDWSKLEQYLEEGLNLCQIAKKMGCTPAAVRHQVKKREGK